MKKKAELDIKLDKRSLYLRSLVVDCLFGGGRGHMGSAMSLIEILRVLYDKFLILNSDYYLTHYTAIYFDNYFFYYLMY